MKFMGIMGSEMVNSVDESKVNALVESMLSNGWHGCPILVWGNTLVTGSHRYAALQKIYEMVDDGEIDSAAVLDQDVAADVSEIVESAVATRTAEDGYASMVDFSDIGWIFEGTWVEEYKNEIEEW